MISLKIVCLVVLVQGLSTVNTLPADTDTLLLEGYRVVPPLPGEACVVCGTPLSEEDITLIVKGRRIPLRREMVADFLREKDRYFAAMQPRGALFAETTEAPPGTSLGGVTRGWFLVGLYILLSILSGGLSAYNSIAKGLKPRRGFLIGFFLPVAGFVYVLALPRNTAAGEIPSGLSKVPETSTPLPCNACGHLNHPSAAQCARCHTPLNPATRSEAQRILHR